MTYKKRIKRSDDCSGVKDYGIICAVFQLMLALLNGWMYRRKPLMDVQAKAFILKNTNTNTYKVLMWKTVPTLKYITRKGE